MPDLLIVESLHNEPFFVQVDSIPSVPDLLLVERLQQNRKFRVFNSGNGLFYSC